MEEELKANGAPEKIYLLPDDRNPNGLSICWYEAPYVTGAIEYTRTDAFIEKALKWYCLDCECNDNCKYTKCFFYKEYERYLKGVTNALPPKFFDGILNEDGSTSDNWRYRHFITKMQDTFIEKAISWLKEQDEMIGVSFQKDFLERFQNYMKGE